MFMPGKSGMEDKGAQAQQNISPMLVEEKNRDRDT